MRIVTSKYLLIAKIGVLVWIGGAILGGLYYYNTIADLDNFYADPSPAPLFIYTFISGFGLIAAIFSGLLHVSSMRR
ncbi:hypothetical protein [Paenibacillus sp. BC26]|uniref:hypothetical protein n=1 Tax=Paenibacillus sp. BC26 TaxID=1881032 RepID=UPI0008E2D690|nr:hypothetical protein [Paenibacillus sp. BC26]SFT04668.1 hypothetical protein SAMN05428962_3960 [Paenibacillus sp. BC26]